MLEIVPRLSRAATWSAPSWPPKVVSGMSFNPSALWPVLRFVRNLVLLPSAIVVLPRLVSYFCGIKIQLWTIVLMATLCLPIAFIIIVLWDLYSVHRAAAALGAVMPPALRGKWPGNIDMLLAFFEEFNTGYPGKSATFCRLVSKKTDRYRSIPGWYHENNGP